MKVPRKIRSNIALSVSTSNLLVIPQNDNIHHRTIIATDALIEDLASFHFSNLPLDLKWIPLNQKIRINFITYGYC